MAVLYITIIKFQESVIIRGIEKKLKEKDWMIYSITTDTMENWENLKKNSDLFIIYLPGDITDNSVDGKNLLELIREIDTTHKATMLIGEEKHHESLIESIPEINFHEWINRPVDITQLIKQINKMTSTEKKEVVPDKHVLIVDDDPSYAKMVREWLKAEYKVNIVTAGMQAFTFLTKTKVDLILLDYEMPIVDGPQVLEMLRQEPSLADIPVIFLTGIGSSSAVSRATHLKPNGYILKSTPKRDLMKYISEVFEKQK